MHALNALKKQIFHGCSQLSQVSKPFQNDQTFPSPRHLLHHKVHGRQCWRPAASVNGPSKPQHSTGLPGTVCYWGSERTVARCLSSLTSFLQQGAAPRPPASHSLGSTAHLVNKRLQSPRSGQSCRGFSIRDPSPRVSQDQPAVGLWEKTSSSTFLLSFALLGLERLEHIDPECTCPWLHAAECTAMSKSER